MEHDHGYIRRLLRLRDQPHVPVLWLLIPWLLGLAWGIRIARLAALGDSAPSGFWASLVWLDILGRLVWFFGGGFLATWVWLYHARPDHPRVLCWATALAFVSIPALPARVVFILPVPISLAMCGAIIEQWTTNRREARRPVWVPPAV